MKILKTAAKACLFFFMIVIPTVSLTYAKDDADKIAHSKRPGFFKELEKTNTVCMKSCPKKIDNIFGIRVICANFEKNLYDETCLDTKGYTPTEYCNCDQTQCAKFYVDCSQDGTKCDVKMSSLGIRPSECACNGNSCEAKGSGYTKVACFMRQDVEAKSCDIHRMVSFPDGRSYHIACDAKKTTCDSDGLKIEASIKVERLPSNKKPGDDK